MKTGFPRYLVCLIGLALTIPGCAGPSAPSAVTTVPQDVASEASLGATPLVTPARLVTTFPLESGTFTLTLRAVDGTAGTVTGTYTGRAVAAVPGNTTAALDLHISGTTGVGSAVTGLRADGTGSFVDEGSFTLSLAIASSTSKILDGLKVNFRGTSRLSCSASHQIVVMQHGTQSTPKFVEITIDLQHLVGSGGC